LEKTAKNHIFVLLRAAAWSLRRRAVTSKGQPPSLFSEELQCIINGFIENHRALNFENISCLSNNPYLLYRFISVGLQCPDDSLFYILNGIISSE
jgi:hypothetical protein